MNTDKKAFDAKVLVVPIPMVIHNVISDLVPTSVSLFTRLPFMSKLCILKTGLKVRIKFEKNHFDSFANTCFSLQCLF